jgi:hypothetical protein
VQGFLSPYIGPRSPIETVWTTLRLLRLRCLKRLCYSVVAYTLALSFRVLSMAFRALILVEIPCIGPSNVYTRLIRLAIFIIIPWLLIRSFPLGPAIVRTVSPLSYNYRTEIRLPISPGIYNTLISVIIYNSPFKVIFN